MYVRDGVREVKITDVRVGDIVVDMFPFPWVPHSWGAVEMTRSECGRLIEWRDDNGLIHVYHPNAKTFVFRQPE